jgi:hypothetical protein
VKNHCVGAEGAYRYRIEFQTVPNFPETGKKKIDRETCKSKPAQQTFGGRNGSQVALNAILKSVLKEVGKGMSS